MLTGKATLTAPIDLLQASGVSQRSVLLLLPVYRSAITPATAEQMASATVGWIFAPLTLQSVLADLALSSGDYQLVLRDVTRPDAPLHLFASTPGGASSAAPISQRLERPVFGRRWQLQLDASPQFVQRLNATPPPSVLLVGLVCSGLMAWLVGALALGRWREKQNALQKAQLAAIVENSADAIISEDF